MPKITIWGIVLISLFSYLTSLAYSPQYRILAPQSYNYEMTDMLPFVRGADLVYSDGYVALIAPPQHEFWIVELGTGNVIEVLRVSRYGEYFVFVYDEPQDENGNPHPIEAFWVTLP